MRKRQVNPIHTNGKLSALVSASIIENRAPRPAGKSPTGLRYSPAPIRPKEH